MNEGWKCPECGRCYAPWVKSCEAVDCGSPHPTTTVTVGPLFTTPDPTTRDPWPSPYQWPNTCGET